MFSYKYKKGYGVRYKKGYSKYKKGYSVKNQESHGVWLLLVIILVFGVNQAAVSAPSAKSIEYWDRNVPTSKIKVNHTGWQRILNRYLDAKHASGVNRFAYNAITKEDRERLQKYLDYLQSMQPTKMSANEQRAYWINLYNAQTVKLVIEGVAEDQITSIKQIRSGIFRAGPWSMKTLLIEQQEVSLDDIEHGILRPNWRDHRLHYVLNCASIGCPNLRKIAFRSDNSEALLRNAEKEFLRHPRAARVEGKKLILSQLFNWYKGDFAEDTDELLDYLKRFVGPDVKAMLSTKVKLSYEYDWDLNKADDSL